MPGRRTEPYIVKVAKGNVGKRPLKPPAHAPPGDFDPPLELCEVARAEWDRIRAEAKWITATDAAALAIRCVTWAEWLQLRADIVVEGLTIETRNGTVKNPKKGYADAARAALLRYDMELGLTVLTRERISAPAENAVDPEDAAMFA